MEPSRGLEPRTCRLQGGCSACLSYDGITLRQGALFCVLGLIPPVGNFAKIHTRGGGGLQPEACRDQSPPPQAQNSPEHSAKAVGGGRDRPGDGTPFAGARRGVGAGGGVRARGSSRARRRAARAWRDGTLARRGRYGGRFDGAGKPWRRRGIVGRQALFGRKAGNRVAGGAPGRQRGLLSVRGGWRGARRAGAGGVRRRGGAAGTADGDSSGGVCRVSPHHTAVVPPRRRVFFRTAGGKPSGFRGGAQRGASAGSGFFLYARVKGLVATKVCPALVWLNTLRYPLVNLLSRRTGVMYVARARTARRRGRETPGGKEPHS